MRLLLIDLDDTLLKTSEFKDQLFKELSNRFDVPMDAIVASYNYLKAKHDVDNWMEKFLTGLHIPHEKVKEINDYIIERLGSIEKNEETFDYLEHFTGYKVLFTYGNHDVQLKKITSQNIDSFVDEVYIVSSSKAEALEKLVKDNKIIISDNEFADVTIVDNDTLLLKEIRRILPWINVIDVETILNSN